MCTDKKSVLDLFYDNVRKHGDKKAVVFGDKYITYNELNELSNDVADKMSDYGVRKSDFVLLYAQKSIEMVSAIYASLKVGAIYVPIDVRYPIERIKYIISDCKPKVILTYMTDLESNIPCINLNKYEKSAVKRVYYGCRDNLDYCIYTSGTTGKPKGVLIYDYSVFNLVMAYKELYGIIPEDTLLQFASIAFDQSVWDIFTILSLGGTLCVLPQEFIGDIELTEKYIVQNNVSVAAFTPAYLRELNPENLPTMRAVESGGAAVEKDVVKKWKQYCRVFNTYGPTEATVNAMTYELQDEIPDEIPIGKPIRNMQAYVVNDGQLCDFNDVGELCLSGVGLAYGYLNNESLTNEKFISNPFGEGKLYRTGDLAKQLPDGNFVCVGRMDSQVKIRGFRIDLGEIESVMKQYGNTVVKDEVNQLGDNILVAFIVSDLKKEEFLERLETILPDYMIPSKIINLDQIPLTINGKVDYEKLHEIYLNDISKKNEEYIPPKTEFECIATSVLKKVLHLDRYGINYNFIECGGNSINAIRVISQLKNLGFLCSVRNLLLAKNVLELEEMIKFNNYNEQAESNKNEMLKKKFEKKLEKLVKAVAPITPTQRYMYKAYKDNKIGDNFLQYVYSIKCKYNYDNLNEAVSLLPLQYDSLTSQFIESDGGVYQITFYEKKIRVEEVYVESEEEMRQCMNADVIGGFDFENGTLIRFTVFLFPSGEKKLICSVSHMIVDGWSMDLILKALTRNYTQLLNGARVFELKNVISALNIPSITQYNNLINCNDRIDIRRYWNKYFENSEKSIMTIAHDNNATGDKYHDIIMFISSEKSDRIRRTCKCLGITENSLFELAFAYLHHQEDELHRNDVLFTKVVSGRDVMINNIENMVGTMINIIPQRIIVKMKYEEELMDLNKKNVQNMAYDKMDFYQIEVNGRLLMDEIQTMIVFCNYYDGSMYGFEYEYDRDQDDIDLSLYIDSLSDCYRLYLTCKESSYSASRATYLLSSYINCVVDIVDECSSDL